MPFFWITSFFIAGIITANQLSGGGAGWFVFCGLSALLGFGLLFLTKRIRSNPGWAKSITAFLPGTRLPYLFLPFCFALGASLYHFQQPANSETTIFGNQNQGKILIRGFVMAPPDRRENLTLVKIQAVEFTREQGYTWKTREPLMVFLPSDASINLGEELILRGKPITPQEDADFSYRQYLAAENIYTQMLYPQVLDTQPGPIRLSYFLYLFREKSLALLARIFPSPESSLVQGILLGDDSTMPADLDESFRRSGTSHLIAISGFNIAIVSSLITLLFARIFGKWRGTAAAIIAISLYTILVGANPPVVRAAIMGSISLLGMLIGRRNGGLNALFLTAGIMLGFRPFLLWSISFQLSAAATLGLILFASPIQRFLQQFFSARMEENLARKVSNGLGEYFFYTIAAQITTLPLLLHHFHQFPWVTLLANPLVLPLQPPLMITSGAALILAWIHPVLGQITGLLSLPFITLTIKVVTWTAGLNFPNLVSPQIGYSLILFWLIILCLPVVLPGLLLKVRNAWKPAFTIVLMLVVSYGLLHTAVDRPDGRLHLYFSGNNKNPAILLISPAGDSFLIQPGSSASELFAFTDPRLPFPQRKLNGMMLTSNENIRLIEEIVQVLSPKDIFLLGHWEPSNTLDLLPGTSANSTHLPDGGILDFGNDLLVALIPGDRQPETVIISWLNFSAELVLEKSTQPPSCAGNVLYTTGTEADLSPACHPQIWISPDYGENTLPDVTLSQSGWLHIISDGNQIWMETQK